MRLAGDGGWGGAVGGETRAGLGEMQSGIDHPPEIAGRSERRRKRAARGEFRSGGNYYPRFGSRSVFVGVGVVFVVAVVAAAVEVVVAFLIGTELVALIALLVGAGAAAGDVVLIAADPFPLSP